MSCGKDSVAMLLTVLEKKEVYPLDEVIYCDTGWDFDSIYNVWIKIKEICKNNGIKCTKIDTPLEEKFSKYSWCGGMCRWGTTAKVQALKGYYKLVYPNFNVVEYIGYARGESKRIKHRTDKSQVFPLIEQGLTENDCLIKCYRNGIHWIENGKELYDTLDRVSCKFCRNKNLKELKGLYKEFPKYWEELKAKQLTTDRQYRKDYTIEELEIKFDKK